VICESETKWLCICWLIWIKNWHHLHLETSHIEFSDTAQWWKIIRGSEFISINHNRCWYIQIDISCKKGGNFLKKKVSYDIIPGCWTLLVVISCEISVIYPPSKQSDLSAQGEVNCRGKISHMERIGFHHKIFIIFHFRSEISIRMPNWKGKVCPEREKVYEKLSRVKIKSFI
jgi:hypothetical protein